MISVGKARRVPMRGLMAQVTKGWLVVWRLIRTTVAVGASHPVLPHRDAWRWIGVLQPEAMVVRWDDWCECK